MNIKHIEVYKVPLESFTQFEIAPIRRGNLVRAMIKAKTIGKRILPRRAHKKSSENVVMKIVDVSGNCGWGEAAPSARVTSETEQTVLFALSKFAPVLIAKPLPEILGYLKALDSVLTGNMAAKACVDIALHDLLGKISGKPLFMLLGGSRREVMTDFSIGLNAAERMADGARAAVEEGFKAIKIKVGGQPSEDFRRVQLVRRAIGDEVNLRVDANEGWNVSQAVDMVKRIAPFNVQFIEQPVPAADLKGLGIVRKNSVIPIMADEAVHTAEDARHVIQADAADMINIKLMKSGGINEAVKIAELAQGSKIPCMIGCMGETRLSITAAVHVAASVENIIYADLDSDLLLRNRFVRRGGAEIEGSIRKLGNDPGLGITELDLDILGDPVVIYP
jgi:L-Ala-D/L-Glu epimerase / N-acetyl-D-glutamate racemase